MKRNNETLSAELHGVSAIVTMLSGAVKEYSEDVTEMALFGIGLHLERVAEEMDENEKNRPRMVKAKK